MENKGNKSGNIYQKLKGAGAWQSKDSAGPIIKGVGIKSPLNMKKSPAKNRLSPLPPGTAEKAQQMKKDKKGPYAEKGKKDPYAKAAKVDPKLGEYVKQRKGLKKDSPEYAKIQNKINKAYGVKKRYDEGKKDEGKKIEKVEKVEKVDKNTIEGDGTTPTTTTTATTEASKNPAKDARKQARLDNKAKRQKKRKANQQKRADRIKKEGGTKVGNFLRKSVKKVKEVVKKKTDGEKISSAAQMKKSALKMKKSAMKMNEGFDKLPADVQAKIKKNKK